MALFDIGVTGLRAAQRALATVGHNVANVNTEGYSRQRVELETHSPQFFGYGFQGKGVLTANVTRSVDEFLLSQVRTSTANHSQMDAFHGLAGQIDQLLGDKQGGLGPALSSFFNSVQDLADHPTSIPVRQTMLTEAQTFQARFSDLHGRLKELEQGVGQRITQTVNDINSLGKAIAEANASITHALGVSGGHPPNDLLDQRDHLIEQLAEKVGVSLTTQEDGAVNVFIGNGQSLVVGVRSMELSVVNDPADPSRPQVAYNVAGASAIISDQLTNGKLGGILEFRDKVLAPAQNGLGRIAVGLATSFNTQHREGMDLNGALGTDFFSPPSPSFIAASGNTGSINLAFDPSNVGGLSAANYSLRYDGANFILTNLSDNSSRTLSGAGPFNVDGLTITVGAAPAAGDQWQLQPLRYAARDFAVSITDARLIAAASPIKTAAALANLSDAAISPPEVLDATDANLLNPVTIAFNDPPTTYQVNGSGSFAYTSGQNIDLNGWRVQITGAPQPGDSFVINSNSGGAGDNANALRLASLQTTGILQGGTATYQADYAALVGKVGSQTRQADISRRALDALRTQAQDARLSVSGVNLDEEAADLLRFQQAYKAAAQAIAVSDSVFGSLLAAVTR